MSAGSNGADLTGYASRLIEDGLSPGLSLSLSLTLSLSLSLSLSDRQRETD
eukprot:COSAG03_NODE_1630_length_3744_cov_5.585185_1_plen_50_part_10